MGIYISYIYTHLYEGEGDIASTFAPKSEKKSHHNVSFRVISCSRSHIIYVRVCGSSLRSRKIEWLDVFHCTRVLCVRVCVRAWGGKAREQRELWRFGRSALSGVENGRPHAHRITAFWRGSERESFMFDYFVNTVSHCWRFHLSRWLVRRLTARADFVQSLRASIG